jgi:hypothetical protein
MFDFSQAGEIIRKENVSIKTLSNLLPSIINNLGQAKLWLKTDTQGYDLEVLKGGAEILPCIDVLQVELAVTPLYEQAPHYIDALSIMREYGFEISGIFPISRNMNNLRIIEFDCVLTRDLRG